MSIRFLSRFIALTALSLFLVPVGCHDPGPVPVRNGGQRKKLLIAVVPKATTHEYWKAVHAGAVRGAKLADVEIIWKGPISESDREGQINIVQDFITKKVDGICLAPLDSRSLNPVIKEARSAGIPTLVFDSGLDDRSDIVSLVATDNFHGGQIAARQLGELLEGKGAVIVLRYAPGSESTVQREEGFLKELRSEFPEIQILSESEHAGASAESALDKAQQLLVKYGDQVQGVFTPCEHVSAGMLRALEERGLAGKVKFVGFDSSPRLVDALRNESMHGLVLQDPVHMAELAVATMASHIRGDSVQSQITTGEYLATKENMDSADIKRLLIPEQL